MRAAILLSMTVLLVTVTYATEVTGDVLFDTPSDIQALGSAEVTVEGRQGSWVLPEFSFTEQVTLVALVDALKLEHGVTWLPLGPYTMDIETETLDRTLSFKVLPAWYQQDVDRDGSGSSLEDYLLMKRGKQEGQYEGRESEYSSLVESVHGNVDTLIASLKSS